MKGDLPAVPGGGTGGGAISERCSGDIDPFSDSSVLAAEWEELVAFERVICGFEGSVMSPNACADIVVLEPFFVLRGLTMGDCRTPRVERCFCGAFLPGFFERLTELAGAE